MNYERDLKIDESALDVEWLRQPKLMLDYSMLAAEAVKNYDIAKESLALVRAELDKSIRTNPENFDITKITEAVVENTIIKQDAYIKANGQLIDAKFELDVAKAAVVALDQKKVSLENLVKLFGLQYFAGPKAPRDLSREWEESAAQKSSNQKVQIRRK